MKKHFNTGFSAIMLIILIALIGAGAYYAGTQNSMVKTTPITNTQTNETTPLETSTTSSNTNIPIEVSSNKKTYTSNIYNVSFELPKDLYVYEKLAFSFYDFSLLKSSTRPKERTAGCECDSDVYGSTITISVRDLMSSKEEAIKFGGSVYNYSGVTQQMLNEENTKTEAYPPAIEAAKKANVTFGKNIVNINANGLKVVRQYSFSELNGDRVTVTYNIYVKDKLYTIAIGSNKSYNKEDDNTLKDIAASFKAVN
ncbi:MAG: hypothetical protein V4576_03170 [Patescibacteria group bacterium]